MKLSCANSHAAHANALALNRFAAHAAPRAVPKAVCLCVRVRKQIASAHASEQHTSLIEALGTRGALATRRIEEHATHVTAHPVSVPVK